MRHAARHCIGITILAVASASLAGELTPPPGPVAPTDRVKLHPQLHALPVVIDEPGSYVLAGPVLDCLKCLDPLPPTSGIVINASDVTLDCNGFQIVGAPGDSINGIFIDASATNVVIRNGTVRDWSSAGITGGSGVTLEDLRIINNGHQQSGHGVSLGSEARVIDCTAISNGATGIFVGFGSHVRDCTATANFGGGIETTVGALANGSVVENCIARNNGGVGFSLGDGTTARGCSASQNGGAGIIIGPGGVISGSSSVLNGGVGIGVINALAHGCAAAWNTGADIDLSAGGIAVDSHDAP